MPHSFDRYTAFQIIWRLALLKAIDAAGLKVRDAGFRADAKLTRISSVTQKMKLDEEGEPDLSDESVRQTVAALWKKQQENFAKVLEALASFKWD